MKDIGEGMNAERNILNSHNRILQPEDYVEPRCVLCGDPYGTVPEVKPVPQQRILQKMDEYMSRRDYAGAERHLLYWLEAARVGHDGRGELTVRNELIGHYRKTGEREKALTQVDAALHLLQMLDYGGSLSAATTYVNAGTACNAFDENERALELFQKAQAIYESAAKTDPRLLGGLYNNMALTLVSLERYREAYPLYQKAMDEMALIPGGELEQAITCLNKANALEDELGMENAESQIFDLLDQAQDLLDHTAAPRDGYYAFVCEKCAPGFSYYGYFAEAESLQKRAEEIYQRAKE